MNNLSRGFWIILVVIIAALMAMIYLGVTGFTVLYIFIILCGVVVFMGSEYWGMLIDYLWHPKAMQLFNRGLHKQNQGDTEGAIGDYQAALRLYPRLGLAEVNWGVIQLRQKDYDGAFAHFTRAIETGHLRAAYYAHYNRGAVYYFWNDFQKALTEFADAIRLQPRFTRVYFDRSLIYLQQGQWEACIADTTQVIKLGRPRSLMAEAFHNRACAYIPKNELDSALADCNQAIQLKPRLYQTYACRGEIYLLKGDAAGALVDFKKSVDLQPDFTAGLAGLALAHQALGEIEQAKRIWSDVIEKDSRFGDVDWLKVDQRWADQLVNEALKLIEAAQS
jgi:tetratricopeptide (TPR) repeat protein